VTPQLPATSSMFGSGRVSPASSSSTAVPGYEALRRDMIAFHDSHEDALVDLILHLDDGQAVLANGAIVEARLPAVLSAAEPLGEADPALIMDDHARRAGTVQQVRLRGVARTTLDELLRWAYGEAVPTVRAAFPEDVVHTSGISTAAAIDLLEICSLYDFERLGAQLREAVLGALGIENFASVLRESHVRHIPGLKQGCMRFALHHFDELIERPEVFMSSLQELPEVVGDLFRLSRRWKNETGDARRTGSPRPAPAPPSTFVGDLGRLYNEARLAEERGKPGAEAGREDVEIVSGPGCSSRAGGRQDLAPDCRIAVGEDVYFGHSAVLAARSDFFLLAFTSDMAERASLLVTLQHVRGDMPRRESMLALLYFMYTGRTTRISADNAMEVLALVGGDQSEESVGDHGGDQGGYLQLHDAATLRLACEAAAEGAVDDGDAILELLMRADALGAVRLRSRAMCLAVHHFKDFALRGALEVLPPRLLKEVLREVAVEFDCELPSAAKGQRWELSMLPAPDGRLENTYEAVSSPDLSCGAGAAGSAGCSEASLVATFDRPVRVRRMRIGVDLTVGDFDAARLNGSRLQYLTSLGSWQDAGVCVSVQDAVVHEIELPRPFVARAFRLVRRQRLAVGLLAFE